MEAAAMMKNGYFVICFTSLWFGTVFILWDSMVVIVWPYASATAVYLAGGVALLRASYSFLLLAENCLDWYIATHWKIDGCDQHYHWIYDNFNFVYVLASSKTDYLLV